MSIEKGIACLLLKGYSLSPRHRGADFKENAMATVSPVCKGDKKDTWIIKNLSSESFFAKSRNFDLEYSRITVHKKDLMPLDDDPDKHPRKPVRMHRRGKRPANSPALV